MSEKLEIITTYVLPGGVGQKQRQGGHITARVTLGHIFAPDGVVAEMNGEMAGAAFSSTSDPVPWIDNATRDDAAAQVERMAGLIDDVRQALAKHIRKSAYFEVSK